MKDLFYMYLYMLNERKQSYVITLSVNVKVLTRFFGCLPFPPGGSDTVEVS